MRAISFAAAYWSTSLFFTLTTLPLLLWPTRAPTIAWIGLYTKAMRFWMRRLAGVVVEIKGREHLPDGPCIIAAKHQSWGDGIVMVSEIPGLAFVTGDHLERFPLLGGILRKMGAIIVDNCGGAVARARLVDAELKVAATEGRRILIYPEGHLAPVGERYRYKRGVFHMYEACGCPVVPVATNLGLYWPQQDWRLRPVRATVEFLPALEPGLSKEIFMTRLEASIEPRSLALIGDGRSTKYSARPPLADPAPAGRRGSQKLKAKGEATPEGARDGS